VLKASKLDNRAYLATCPKGIPGSASIHDQGIHSHRPRTPIDNRDRVLAGIQIGDFTNSLLGLARTRRGQVGCGTGLAIDLNLDLSGSCFSWGNDRYAAAGEGATPNVTGRVACGQVVVVVAGSQVAAAQPSVRYHVEIVIVDPPFIMSNAQDSARRCQRLAGDSRKRLHRGAGVTVSP